MSAEIASGHKLTAWGPDTPHTQKDTDTDTFCGRTQAHAKRDKHTQNHLKSTMMTLMSVPSSPPWITPAEPPAPWPPEATAVEFSSAGFSLFAAASDDAKIRIRKN